MSLFRGQDKTLPLLTQIAQIDFPNRAEAEEFYRDSYERIGVVDEDAQMTNIVSTTFEDHGHLPQEIDKFIELGSIAQSIVSQIANGRFLTRRQMEAMKEFQQQYQDIVTYRWYAQNGDDEYVRPDMVVFTMPDSGKYNKCVLFADLTRHTVEQILNYKRKIQKLRVCKECGNPFIIQPRHPDQEYCSHRCAMRITQRRYREKQRKNQAVSP